MRYVLVASFLVGCLVMGSRAASAQPAPGMLMQAQAADVLSDLLTWSVDRAGARVTAMQEFLAGIGKQDAYSQNKPQVHGKSMFFTQVFNGAVDFVEQGGAKYADPNLASLNQSQLMDHFNTLQAYNMQQFIRLNQLRDESNSMATYLESIGQFEDYLKWAKAKVPAGDATAQPEPKTPQELADKMQDQIESARTIMWSKAVAMGMSKEDFEKRWRQHVEQYREQVARKVEGVQATAGWLTKSEMAKQEPPAPPAQAPVLWHSGPPVQIKGPTLPAPVQSKYTASYYSGVDSELWNNWGDPYGDVTYVRSGGHH
jgi:hypothetical protein